MTHYTKLLWSVEVLIQIILIIAYKVSGPKYYRVFVIR